MKILKHLDDIKKDIPVHLGMSLTGRCDHDCRYCNGVHTGNDIQHAKSIIDQWAALGTRALNFSGGGNPVLHSNFLDISQHCVNNELELGILTNMIKDDAIIQHIRNNYQWCRVSIDAVSTPTYQAVRRTTDTITDAWGLLRELSGGNCRIGANFIILEENIHEIETFATRCKEIGIDYVHYNRNREDTFTIDTDILKEIKEKLYPFEIQYEPVRHKQDLVKKYNKCNFSISPYQFHNGAIFYCCYLSTNEAEYNHGLIGNVYENTVETLWHNRQHPDINKCPICWHDKENEILEIILDKHIRDANFV